MNSEKNKTQEIRKRSGGRASGMPENKRPFKSPHTSEKHKSKSNSECVICNKVHILFKCEDYEINGALTKPIRALCDTGSQPNLITSSIIKKYGFESQHVRAGITGVSGYPLKIIRQIRPKIIPWFN